MEISVAEYARRAKVSHTAIHKAVREGRIKKGYNPDTKKIIPDLADKEYGSQTSIEKVKADSKKPVSKLVETETLTNLPAERQELIFALAAAEGLRPEDIQFESGEDYNTAITKKTIIAGLIDKHKLLKLQGSLVDRVQVENTLFSYANSLKRFLRTLPQVVSADMRAASTDLDAQMLLLKAIDVGLERFANGVDLTSDET